MSMGSRIRARESELRDLMQRVSRTDALIKRPASWNMLCSCLDAIGDTSECIDVYSPAERNEPLGARYLALYGILQALYVQQDAVSNLAKALGIEYTRDPILTQVRDVRNDAVGHPTKSRYGQAFNFIVQLSVSRSGFDLMTTYPDARAPTFQSVSVRDLILKQTDAVAAALEAMIMTLKEEEAAHRRTHRDEKLSELLDGMSSYEFQKLFEGVWRADMRELAAAHITSIQARVAKYEEAIGTRGIAARFESGRDTLEKLNWPLEELRKFFVGEASSVADSRMAYIYATFSRQQYDSLAECAAMIDDEYARDVP